MILLALLACGSTDCPAGTASIPALEARILARLRPEELPTPTGVCFGEGVEPALTTSGRLILDSGWEEAALSARAAHLLLHRRQGLGPDADCAGWQAAEGEARALERRLREAAGLPAELPLPLDRGPCAYAVK